MILLAPTLVALVGLLPFVSCEKVGYFESTSCADPKGLASCYKLVDERYSTCINENCGGGGEACSKSCGGSVSCMNAKCPGLGIDCMNACAGEQSALQIDCAGAHCWNQVYSCEYQNTVLDFISVSTNPNRDGLPYWPVPDDAPGSCSCNIGKIDYKQSLILDQMTECSNNMTNIEKLTEVDDINDYGKACLCCAYSSIISSIWDTCPGTKPSLLSADEWFNSVLIPGDWDKCGPYLEAFDCAGDLGYDRADAGGNKKFWSPTSMPTNGTKTASNIAGYISSPVSGNTFTWTFGRTTNPLGQTTSPVLHTVTVSSVKAVVTDSKAQATSDSGSTATGTAASATASETKPGAGSSITVPSWTIIAIFVAVLFSGF
ncbi:unnamed protein product [Penicillium salamii]|uniref:Uncharacterized protein n=1 Tax=Penicillium salamii TaxID=1612424 RepID=A0A9W4K272_9EURO|nr:unnamed protein product [Penicillium salamii]CAG7962414.1 unnamed protein product [Penicillium salamii]CAG8056978.1 unnamed protein product [Penicillium salamii]CAG8069562.1 unnamed protein product [Penicillium salamii]CAG8153861.1 unnamed protein product [Penicillium salamii]